MNATGESDLQNYYDYIDTLRESVLKPIIYKILPVLAMSAWGAIPDDLDISFPTLWTPTAKEISEIVKYKAETIVTVFQAGLMDQATAQKELKKLSEETGLFDSITDEEIASNKGKTFQDVTALRDPLMGLGYGDTEPPFDTAAHDEMTVDYSPNQPRDKNGRWSEGGGVYDKPTGFTTNQNGEKTLDNKERKRYDEILVGERTSDGVKITSLSNHAYDRAAQRNISPGEIRRAIKATPTLSKKDPTCNEYDNKCIRTVVNFHSGNVISVMRRRMKK